MVYKKIILCSLIILFISSYCFSEEKILNLSPLYYKNSDPSRQFREIEVLGPLFKLKYTPEERSYSLKPFFNFKEEIAEKEKNVDFLWPIGKYRRNETKKEMRILPVYYSKYEIQEDGVKTGRSMILPFFIWGKTEKDRYYLFFPVYGTLRGWFNREEIKIFLFPLYSETAKRNDRSWELLWPFFHYAKGDGHIGYRFLPFYGYDKVDGRHVKRFFLWPFINFQKFYEGDKLVKERFLFPPVYGYQKSEDRKVGTVLFPLFAYDKKINPRNDRYDIIWPVFSFSSGEGRQIRQFFPLFRIDKKETSSHNVFLWPFFWFDRVNLNGYESSTNRFVPLFADKKEHWKKVGKSSRNISLWPLLSYKRDRDENVKFSSLSLIPFIGPSLFADKLEENYSFLWTLYKYERDKEGESESTLLWNLYKDKKGADKRSINIPLLFSYNRNKEEKGFSILMGLLGHKKEEEKSTWKVFYIPFSKKEPEKKNSLD